MVQMQASSLKKGILAKTRVVKMIHQFEPQIEIEGATDAELAFSFIMDILALVENKGNFTISLTGRA